MKVFKAIITAKDGIKTNARLYPNCINVYAPRTAERAKPMRMRKTAGKMLQLSKYERAVCGSLNKNVETPINGTYAQKYSIHKRKHLKTLRIYLINLIRSNSVSHPFIQSNIQKITAGMRRNATYIIKFQIKTENQ